MNFTLHEYFYKLYNKNMVMMLLPIGEFLGIYYLLLSGILPKFINDERILQFLLFAFPIVILTLLTIVHLGVRKKLTTISNEVGLGRKLDLYADVAKRKTFSIVWASLLLAAGFFLTTHEWFNFYFGAVILWSWWQWPSPRKVCDDLKLKGDERQMVITKGEAFKNISKDSD
ncbi:MAG: hypothetical protein JST48_07885 [Bacteroidetes bacterium]|nr:hypothetical protein [Bacteroidota bacterium]